MLVHYNQTSDILYYEILDIPLPELQGLKTLKVAFHHATKEEVAIHSIRLPKNSTVADVINDLKNKVELSRPDAELRLLEVFYHKIYKIFPPGEKIENINDQYWTLRAEEIPKEEKNLGPHDCLIHVYHFTRDPNQNQMVNHTKRELHNVFIRKLYREHLFEEMLREPNDIAARRKRCREKLCILQQVYKTLDEIPLEAESIEKGYTLDASESGLHGLPSSFYAGNNDLISPYTASPKNPRSRKSHHSSEQPSAMYSSSNINGLVSYPVADA